MHPSLSLTNICNPFSPTVNSSSPIPIPPIPSHPDPSTATNTNTNTNTNTAQRDHTYLPIVREPHHPLAPPNQSESESEDPNGDQIQIHGSPPSLPMTLWSSPPLDRSTPRTHQHDQIGVAPVPVPAQVYELPVMNFTGRRRERGRIISSPRAHTHTHTHTHPYARRSRSNNINTNTNKLPSLRNQHDKDNADQNCSLPPIEVILGSSSPFDYTGENANKWQNKNGKRKENENKKRTFEETFAPSSSSSSTDTNANDEIKAPTPYKKLKLSYALSFSTEMKMDVDNLKVVEVECNSKDLKVICQEATREFFSSPFWYPLSLSSWIWF